MDSPGKVDRIIRRLAAMKAQRMPHEHVWRRCYDMTYPLRADGLNGEIMDAQSGQNRKAEILDNTATDAVRLLASSIMSGLTPANARWFALDVGDESDEERRWLDDVAQLLWENIHAANYDASKFECVIDAAVAGWFALYIDEDRERGGLRFEQWPLSQCYVTSSRPGMPVDTVYRCFKLTAEQAVNEYGSENVSERVRDSALRKPDEPFEFVQVIEPRTAYLSDGKLPRNLPYASCHIDLSSRKVCRESGYHEMPVIAPRWSLLPGSPYGIGPVSDALPDIGTLNRLLLDESVAMARAAAGVYVAEDDGVLNPRTVKVRGGTVIVANSVDSIKPLPTGADFNVTFSKADQLRASIRRTLMADQLQPQDGPAMTATEVHVRVALIRQLLGPLFGRFQAEDLAPTIERVFGLAYRAGVLRDPPESLAGRAFTVRYQSPLARAQKLEEVTAIERLMGNAAVMAQGGKPEVLDLIDGDESLRVMADGLGAPGKTLLDSKAVAALRKARAEQQQREQQQAMQQQTQIMATQGAIDRSVKAAA